MSDSKVIADNKAQQEFLAAPISRGEMIALVNKQLEVSLAPLRAEIVDIKETLAMHMQVLAASEGVIKEIATRVGLAEEEMAAIGAKAVAVFDATLKAAMTEMHKAAAQMKVGKA